MPSARTRSAPPLTVHPVERADLSPDSVEPSIVVFNLEFEPGIPDLDEARR